MYSITFHHCLMGYENTFKKKKKAPYCVFLHQHLSCLWKQTWRVCDVCVCAAPCRSTGQTWPGKSRRCGTSVCRASCTWESSSWWTSSSISCTSSPSPPTWSCWSTSRTGHWVCAPSLRYPTFMFCRSFVAPWSVQAGLAECSWCITLCVGVYVDYGFQWAWLTLTWCTTGWNQLSCLESSTLYPD